MSKLHPVPDGLVPMSVGENVAFRETHELGGKYGRIKALGLEADGSVAFDLLVYDPSTGFTGKETTVRRTRMEEIQ